ncbi:MAG TPA: amidohydrolase family protein [Candidatus Dormibacteraeota bacterium]|nr:amidohydrolase family protein [Candidatus Dormibacteraeota bacterium]
MYDVIIRGAAICDGSGEPPRTGDIAIADGRIAALGAVSGTARRTIDADGLVAAPGFIDVHTHYDCQVSWDPALTPSSWHGVTSVVMGNCGFTIAPCRAAHRDLLMEMLLYVEGMPTEALRAGVRWEWESFPDYLDAVERARPAINTAVFVGHSAVRYFVMGDAAVERAATDDEMACMQAVVRDALRAGAIGFSTSESPTHFFGSGVPVPSRVAPRDEFLALASVLAEFGRGIVEVAPLNLLGATDDKLDDQRFYAEVARAAGRPVTWAPLLANPFDPSGATRIIEAAAAAQRAGAQVVPQVGCRPLEVRISFETAGIAIANNPFWRPILELPRAERCARLASREFRDQLRAMSSGGGFVAALGPSWGHIFPRLSAHPAHAPWIDRSIADIVATRGGDPVDTLLDLALEADLDIQFGIPIMNTDDDTVGQLLRHPAGIIALSDAGAHVDTLADQGFTTTLLARWARDLGVLSLPEAVRRITAIPAELYGLRGRGQLREGWAADVTVFDPSRLGLQRTELVHDLPGGAARLIQRPIGVEYVLVNGEPLVERGAQTDARSGRVLRGA